MGHVILGDRLLQKKFEELTNFPNDIKLKLNHMIISRFSRSSHGSKQRPSFPEATALVHADHLESSIQGFNQMFEENKNKDDIWSYNRKSGHYLYLK